MAPTLEAIKPPQEGSVLLILCTTGPRLVGERTADSSRSFSSQTESRSESLEQFNLEWEQSHLLTSLVRPVLLLKYGVIELTLDLKQLSIFLSLLDRLRTCATNPLSIAYLSKYFNTFSCPRTSPLPTWRSLLAFILDSSKSLAVTSTERSPSRSTKCAQTTLD